MKEFIRKIWDAFVCFIPKVTYDKLLHFIAGLLIAAFFDITLGMAACIAPAVLAGFIKESFDLWTTGKWDWRDFAATCAGGLAIQILVVLALL